MKYKTNTANHAKNEFIILNATVKDAIISPFEKEILALCEKFGKSGQSGGSAPYTAQAISQADKKLCLQEPVCDITGIDEEWNEVDGNHFQNNRLSSVFKESRAGKPYYLYAIVFKGKSKVGFTGTTKLVNGETLRSSQFIKLPFKPKTFYVDVIETEWSKDPKTGELIEQEGGGWWTSIIKDEKQLKEVFEYYIKPND
ncbi:MAG: hypothetical protein V3W20_08195 [Candidatus Neomarinimicrobiota bacterium]